MAVEDHENYAAAHTEYVTQLAQAKAARDEVAEQKAENGWLRAQMTMGSDLSSRSEAAAARTAAIAKLKAEHPNVPEAAYSHVPDIKTMEALVKEIAPTFTAPAPQGDAPVVPVLPAGSATAPKRAGNPFDDPAQAREIASRAKKGDRDAQEHIRKEVFSKLIAPTMAKFGPARADGMKKAGY